MRVLTTRFALGAMVFGSMLATADTAEAQLLRGRRAARTAAVLPLWTPAARRRAAVATTGAAYVHAPGRRRRDSGSVPGGEHRLCGSVLPAGRHDLRRRCGLPERPGRPRRSLPQGLSRDGLRPGDDWLCPADALSAGGAYQAGYPHGPRLTARSRRAAPFPLRCRVSCRRGPLRVPRATPGGRGQGGQDHRRHFRAGRSRGEGRDDGEVDQRREEAAHRHVRQGRLGFGRTRQRPDVHGNLHQARDVRVSLQAASGHEGQDHGEVVDSHSPLPIGEAHRAARRDRFAARLQPSPPINLRLQLQRVFRPCQSVAEAAIARLSGREPLQFR